MKYYKIISKHDKDLKAFLVLVNGKLQTSIRACEYFADAFEIFTNKALCL